MKEKVYRVETLTPEQAGKIIGKNAEYIRAGLRLQRFDFGSAVPPKKEGENWNYNIIKSKFYKYAGINERKYYTKKCDLSHKIREEKNNGRIYNIK